MVSCCSPSSDRAVDAEVGFARVEATDKQAARMAFVPGGSFAMGNEDDRAIPGDGEGPVRQVQVSGFLVDPRCVTNAQFAVFVRDTDHVTDAERFDWSFVFKALVAPTATTHVIDATIPDAPWWRGVAGATWQAPEGPGSSIEGRWRHPVVHVSWRDAQAYARWVGKRLLTEAEWEKAARGGLVGARYPWGDELTPAGRHHANIWQGQFPTHNTGEDGYLATAPVDAFPANGFGLYNMSGNVWEWCFDAWSTDWHAPFGEATRRDPFGPLVGDERVIRGGSYLCHASYCERYRVAARTHNTPDTTTGHMSFRLAADVPSGHR